jgi:hypothetical protein
MSEVRAVQHGGGVAGLILGPDGGRLDPVRKPRHHRQHVDRKTTSTQQGRSTLSGGPALQV